MLWKIKGKKKTTNSLSLRNYDIEILPCEEHCVRETNILKLIWRKDMYGAIFQAFAVMQLMSSLFWDEDLRYWVIVARLFETAS